MVMMLRSTLKRFKCGRKVADENAEDDDDEDGGQCSEMVGPRCT